MPPKDGKTEKQPTSKDVAKLAGVSQASVSRAFNSKDGKGVKPEAMKKIMASAAKLGYVPNLVAKGMISGKSNMVGLVVGHGIGPFYHAVIMEIVSEVQKKGKQCLVFKMDKSEKIDQIISYVLQFQVDAIIITSPAISKDMEKKCSAQRVPIILFNRFFTDVNISTVYTDPVQGGAMAAQHLLDFGHSQIGYFRFVKEEITETEKKIGFSSVLRNNGIYHFKEECAEYNYNSGYQAGLRFLQKNKGKVTAVFCTSDLIALGLMDAARKEFGLRIPEDLSILGYDNIPMASWRAYDLDTVAQPVNELAEKTVSLAFGDATEKNEPVVHQVPLKLMIRGSVCAPEQKPEVF